jgi:hypothetical protein
MPNAGWVLTQDADLLYLASPSWILGLRYSYAKPFYEAHHEGETAQPSNVIHRAGPLIAYRLSNATTGPVQSPTLLLITQWHMDHRWRAGQEVSRALPYVGLGFLVRGDLLGQ